MMVILLLDNSHIKHLPNMSKDHGHYKAQNLPIANFFTNQYKNHKTNVLHKKHSHPWNQ